MRLITKTFFAFGTIGIAILTGTMAAAATGQSASDAQAPLLEDYVYPGADGILATYGVKLIAGDGHILFIDCTTPPDGNVGAIEVRTSAKIGANKKGVICFKVTAATGHLELMVPAVYEIHGDGLIAGSGHKVKAALTTDAGEHTSVNVDPNGSTPVGVGSKPGAAPTTLLQLDVAP
ncbi:hypothetical protein [Amycolatopsis sp. H20-H5]|uniref:hypothetical protein n=1 Tax=Amycolatopsis sp. H20-H5 TaxID=3046309 RepID=UPI002DBE5A02|nr:hypothetical protein [Amycolatopsis sp. H20-H5]MEC3980196.1 hypothetical protein [Amycolatopsis sp. H20-H5]